jgi:hypothetical protein
MRNCFLFFLFPITVFGQLKINEASNTNSSTLLLPNGESPDWIELYNGGSTPANMLGYGLSDDPDDLMKWIFPSAIIQPMEFLTVFATGANNTNQTNHFETSVFADSTWQYTIPTAGILNWNSTTFNTSSWLTGAASIGYGDGDDATDVLGPYTTIYSRISFNCNNVTAISEAILDVDFDDGFVAYLNGVEIARSGMSGNPPLWDEFSSDHEATLYQGGPISTFNLDLATIKSVLIIGTNVFAIEVHNASASSSDLTCTPYLTFGYDQPGFFASGTVHQFFAMSATSALESNFKINTSGETLYLSNPAGVLIDSLVVLNLEPNMSNGKFPDGSSTTVLFNVPTPNATNNTSIAFNGYEIQPTIVNVGGVFTSSNLTVSVINNSVSGGELRYTTNGNNPESTSALLIDSIVLDSNCVLKVTCFPVGTNLLPSIIEIETFLFSEDFELPIVLLTIDSADLYGTSGLFVNYNWETDWKKPCVVEYFDKNGIKQFESRSSVKPDGGAGGSRTYPQHSVTIEPANSIFGEGEPIHYPIIPRKPYIQDYYALYLRNGSMYWNHYPQKDATFARMMDKTNVNSQAYTPAVVFLNGQYFGIYELREKANEGYFENNYGNHLDSLDLLSISYFYGQTLRTVKGSDSSFYSMKNLITSSNPLSTSYFVDCHKKLDLYNFSDYIIGENWFANTDWIFNNMKMARTRTYDNKWRFFLQDLEYGLGYGTDYTHNMFDWFEASSLQPNPFWDIYAALIQNPEFKNYFVNRFADLMNTAFQADHYMPIVNSMYSELLPDLPRHLQLWNNASMQNGLFGLGTMANYTNQRNILLDQFINRNTFVRDQMVTEFNLVKKVNVSLDVFPAGAGYIKISTIIPETLPWTGVYFDGVPVKITAIANPGYTFQNWVQNMTLPAGSLLQSSITQNIDQNDLFKAVFIGSPEEPSLTISEIQYNPDPSVDGGNWIELHNYGNSSIDLTGWSLKSKKFWDKYSFEDGVSIPSGEFLVVCQDTNLFKMEYPSVSNFVGATGFPWSNKMDSIKLYNGFNQVAIQMEYRDELPFPVCADGWGRSLENKLFQSSPLDSSVWFCGCIGGSPGKAYTPCYESVQFTEINYNNKLTSVNAGDWVELHNNSNLPIDMTGYSFKDAKNDHVFTFPALTLNAGSYLVLNNDLGLFENRHPMVENRIGTFAFGINSEDALRLYDASGRLLTSVLFGNANTWPNQPSYEDYTLEYTYQNGYTDPNSASSWFVGCEGGSPGLAYTACPVLPTGEILNIYPNPTQGMLQVAFDNSANSSNSTDIFVFDMQGKLVHSKTVFSEENVVGVQLDLSELQHGVYFIRLQQDAKVFQKPFVKI